MKAQKKEKVAVPVQERSADFTVLMLGQRRTGKSSVLSSMITSMEKICVDTGFRFTADDDTKIYMRTKLSQLQNIFHVHKGETEFSTMEGYQYDTEYSVQTDADISYRFILEQINSKKKNRAFVIDFVDVRGESMTENFAPENGLSVNDRIMQSGVLIIAIDSPALMEGRLKDGVGEYHKGVNLPDDIYNHITAADAEMRKQLDGKQQLMPRLVLFVPLKCEKYYYECKMGELNSRIRTGYKNLFTFLEANSEYTVVITPILTLGDVVFDHYKTRTIQLPNGKNREVAITFGNDGESSLRTVPKFPMFCFRNENAKFSPQYCEQPLLYVLAYVNAVSQLFEKKSKGGKIKKVLIWGAIIFFFGGLGALGAKGMQMIVEALSSDPELKAALQKVTEQLKISGDGYELVYDNLGLGKRSEI